WIGKLARILELLSERILAAGLILHARFGHARAALSPRRAASAPGAFHLVPRRIQARGPWFARSGRHVPRGSFRGTFPRHCKGAHFQGDGRGPRAPAFV